MEPRKEYRDVPIGDRNYRVRLLDARTGAWLYAMLSSKASPDGELITMAQLINAFHGLDEETFRTVQNHVLRKTFLIETKDDNEFQTAVLKPDGSGFSFKDMDTNPTLVFQLTELGVMNNVLPFFPERESDSKQPNQSGGNPPSIQP